ncbi:Crp/Fnr family transcriptional regulator [Salinisphaera orenii]|uniref:Crp/Fnr family transcriptional regulator n=1 Tax=Salinisphaera orenii TaxID=856731 RepID=UPI000DBE0B5A
MGESRRDDIGDLASHHLFEALDEHQRERVAEGSRRIEFGAAQNLFNQGDEARRFFLVVRGSVKLYRVSPSGHEKIMRFVGTGQSFAEAVMFMAEPTYPVSAEGVNAGTLLAVDTATFRSMLRESFDTFCAVAERMTRRIQAHWDEIEALTLANSRFRVIDYLLEHRTDADADSSTVTLGATKSLIATQLAITPETLSRTLRQLNDAGLIRSNQANIEIPSVKRLRAALRQD